MRKRACSAAILATVALGSTSCSFDQLTRDRLLVWHDWPAPEAAVIDELLEGYRALDPDLELIVEYVPDDELEARFAAEVRSGFGPDIVIGLDATRLAELVAADAVREITDAQLDQHGFGDLDPKAMEAMSVDAVQRGIPLTASTDVLYVRRGITPPDTLDDVMELADDGHSMAIPMEFFKGYWGVDAFDGSVFDTDGALAPDGGFVDWMEWLVAARPHPNVILEEEYEVLRDLFADGKIDLFVGGSRELGTFRTMLRESTIEADGDGPDTDAGSDASDDDPGETTTPTLTDIDDLEFDVTVLPGRENGQPGGFMDVEGMVVNRHTAVVEDSLAVMAYLTNVPSQGRIARSGVGRIPINRSVSIDPTISPIEAALVTQQHRAVILPRNFEHDRTELASAADEVVAQVTRGLLAPEDAGRALETNFARLKESADG